MYAGNEEEVYTGEFKDLILSVLSDSLGSLENAKRRKDVVCDVIEANDYQETGKKKAEKLKQLLKDYKHMTDKLNSELEAMKFDIKDAGKHYKVTYNGDGRYLTILSKTPSDINAGMNFAMETIKMVF